MAPRPIFISCARMHHITNPTKYRTLRHYALDNEITGLVKVGKPGVLVFNGTEDSVNSFLERVKNLRYMRYGHLDTKPLLDGEQPITNDGTYGLQGVENMKDLIARLDRIGQKDWFRIQMKMIKGPVVNQGSQDVRSPKKNK